ncbi:MAG TPA: GGDEF domain-containing protein [Motiliproteus sp.]
MSALLWRGGIPALGAGGISLPVFASSGVFSQSTSLPVPLVLVGLVILLLCVHQVVRLNHKLRDEVRSRWHAEDELLEIKQRLELALWGSGTGCWDWNLEFDEVLLDQRSAELLGVEAGAGVLNLHDSHPACALFRQWRSRIMAAAPGEQLEQLYSLDQRWLQCTGKRLQHGNTAFRALGTLLDVSQAHAYQVKLEQLSTTDALTGVLNRRYFFERLSTACAQAQREGLPLAVAMLDIDLFKQVNDQYGHLVGDKVLEHFATQLKRCCRPYDLVARFGGEEFIVQFSGIDRFQAQLVLSRYRQTLQQTPVAVADGEYICRFSAGIADEKELGLATKDCEALVALADARLYRAKERGRDRIVVDDPVRSDKTLDTA